MPAPAHARATIPAPVAFTASASASCSSAASTRVHAAALITASGCTEAIQRSTAALSRMSHVAWVRPTISWPAAPPASTRSPPSCPRAPNTRYFSAAHLAADGTRTREPRRASELDPRVVAEHQAHGGRTRRGFADLALLPDERTVDLPGDVVDPRALEDDAVLDLRVAYDAVEIDRRERTDVGVVDHCAAADDRRPAHNTVAQRRSLLHHHLAVEAHILADGAVAPGLEGVEDHPVCFEDVIQAAGVLPPALDDVGQHALAGIDHALDRVGDLQLPARARLDGIDRLEDQGREEVDAHQGKVGARHRRLLHERDHPAGLELRDAKSLRLGNSRQQDHGVSFGARELVDERADPLGDQVVAEVHDEAVPGEKVASDAHRVRKPERRLLRDEGDAGAESRPVADCRADLIGGVAHDDPDVVDPGLGQRIDCVEENRPVGDGDELLRAGVGDRPKPRPLAAAEDEPLHRDPGARIAAGYQQVPGVGPSRNGPATTSDAPVATMVTVQRGAKIGLTNTANPLNATTLCHGDAPRGGAPLPIG